MRIEDLPAGLEAAIRAGEMDLEEYGRSGYPAMRDWILGVTADAPEDLPAWIEQRDLLFLESTKTLFLLEQLAGDGYFPRWWGSWWHQTLKMPWAERLEEALEAARVENF